MVRVNENMIKLLSDKELFLYQKSLNEQNECEIKHWEKVAKSREKGVNNSK